MNVAPEPGPLALVGSGEYLPQMASIEAALLANRPARYVQLATAAAPEGPSVVERWHELGTRQAERLGAEPVVVNVVTRDDANSPAFANMIKGAGLIYLSGGSPTYLADTLRDSLVWATIVETWRGGAALAGCSAGAMALGGWIPSLRHPRRGSSAGLGLLPRLGVVPHFDAFAARVPDFLTRVVLPDEDVITVFGIDEETALVGGPSEWIVQGHRSAWRLTRDGRVEIPLGTTVSTPQ